MTLLFFFLKGETKVEGTYSNHIFSRGPSNGVGPMSSLSSAVGRLCLVSGRSLFGWNVCLLPPLHLVLNILHSPSRHFARHPRHTPTSCPSHSFFAFYDVILNHLHLKLLGLDQKFWKKIKSEVREKNSPKLESRTSCGTMREHPF